MKKSCNVTIRPLEIKDAYTSVNWRNKPIIWEKTINSPQNKITLKDELSWIKKVITEKSSSRFAILVDGEYIGNVQLTNIEDKESNYGIFLGNTDYWGKGIAKKATILIIKHGFNNLSLNKIKLRVRQNHDRAYKMYLKIGFKVISQNEELIFMEMKNDNI